jgi:S1-C subfamily serine protease
VRKVVAGALLLALVFGDHAARASDDASVGYIAVRPSLVKVWAFDRTGRPIESGSGIVVDSNVQHSLVLTASHVLAGAVSIRVDVSRDLHDIAAHVERTGPRDLTLLTIDRGGLRAVRFAPRTHQVVEGNLVAVAGYVKKDELIGIVGQEPRVLFPGTIASRPENGLYLELENVHIEEGLSGGAVFDPGTGKILGIVTSRTSDQRGGFADSGALVVVPFLQANNVASVASPAVQVAQHQQPSPQRSLPLPSLPQQPLPRVVAIAPPAVQPRAIPTLPAVPLQAVLAVAAPRDPDGAIVSWQAGEAQPQRFVFVRAGCRIAVTIDVNSLQFVVAHAALVQPHHHGGLLGITLTQRAAATDACADVADAEPSDAAYDPTAMSFDGHHVTMRFAYAGDPENSDRFPSDASLDADLSGDSVTATVQFFDRDWSGSFALPLARTALAAVSSTW